MKNALFSHTYLVTVCKVSVFCDVLTSQFAICKDTFLNYSGINLVSRSLVRGCLWSPGILFRVCVPFCKGRHRHCLPPPLLFTLTPDMQPSVPGWLKRREAIAAASQGVTANVVAFHLGITSGNTFVQCDFISVGVFVLFFFSLEVDLQYYVMYITWFGILLG